MLSLFSGLKSFLKQSTICTDGIVFRLHCKFTALFLISASILLSCRQYFGDPITCIQSDIKPEKLKVVENFCWIHSTFILPSAWHSPIGTKIPHAGIDTWEPGMDRKFHAYYQWVAFVLLLQGIMFYLPHYLWKAWEKGTIKAFALNLQHPVLPEEDREKSYSLLSRTLRVHWGHFSSYYAKYVFCELLTFINVVGQMLLLDTFLGGAFSNFGIRVLQWTEWDQYDRTDPLVETFPRVTKCTFRDFGSSGTPQVIDALCVLPLNILNEKIFIFLWFWLVILCCLTAGILVYRLLLFLMPLLRYSILVFQAPLINRASLEKLVQVSGVGDWFVLHLLSKNIAQEHYRSVVHQLAASLDKNHFSHTSAKSIDASFV